VGDAPWIKRHLDERFGLFSLHDDIDAKLFLKCLPTARQLSQLVVQELDPHHLPTALPNTPELVECEDTIRSQAFLDGLRRIYLHESAKAYGDVNVNSFDEALAVKLACLQQCRLVRVERLPMQLKRVDTKEVIAIHADKTTAEVKCSGILTERKIYLSALLLDKKDIVGQLTIEIDRLLGYHFKDRLFLQVAIGNITSSYL
jgi:hypothetical protein